MNKVMCVFGTRPEAIKMAPVIKEMRKFPEKISCQVCVTSQHREMLKPFLDVFDIKPDFNLDIMQENQSIAYITSTVLTKMTTLIEQEKPKIIVVQGDTTTSMAAALAAYYKKIKVAHVEAGLRTWDIQSPFPEEINRVIIDSVSDFCFAHTEKAKENLVNEHIAEEKILVTGNTVVDALLDISQRDISIEGTALEKIPFGQKKIILVTAHRRESHGGPFDRILKAVKEIALKNPDILIVYPVHLNPNIKEPATSKLRDVENIMLIEPLDYPCFVYLMSQSFLILSDSGGIQEEAPSLSKPVLLMREKTERPESVETGAVRIVGTETENIVHETMKLIEDEGAYEIMASAGNPYGDGSASQKIVSNIIENIY